MEEKQLSKFFIIELFKSLLRNKNVIEICSEHLEYHFLPSEPYKLIWQSIDGYYKTNKQVISLGILGQQFRLKPEVITVLGEIAEVEPPPQTVIVEQLEIFIRQMMFIDGHRELAKTFNDQDQEGAFNLLKKFADKVSDFKLTKKHMFNNIVEGMTTRIEDRKNRTLATSSVKEKTRKIPTGIMLELDTQLRGGIDRGDTLMWMAISGGGKSKAMKYSGYFNAKIGNRVVHIQAEGTRDEAEICYDTAFAGVDLETMESGLVEKDRIDNLSTVLSQIEGRGGEIHLKAFEQFGSVSLLDIKRYMDEIVDTYGPIDLLILDYIEKVEPGDRKYRPDQERQRREALGDGFKNLCMEYDCAGITATQAVDIKHSVKNDPKFVLRREDISEFKGMVKPFSYFVTINGTDKEIAESIRRIHIDKFRKYKSPIPTFSIGCNFDNERFYDNSKTQLISRYGKVEGDSA